MRTWQFFLEKVGTCARGSAARRPYSATGLSGRNSGDGENVQKQRHAVNPCFPEILKKYSLWKNPRNFRQFCLFRRLPARRDSLLQPGQLEKGGLARGFERAEFLGGAGGGPEGLALIRDLTELHEIDVLVAPEEAQHVLAVAA